MTFGVTLFLFVTAFMLIALPRRIAPTALLIGACYMTLGQAVEIGSLTFSVIRILILCGCIRVVTRGEVSDVRPLPLDKLMIAWAVWALISASLHKTGVLYLITRLGVVYTIIGLYFVLRCLCKDIKDAVRVVGFLGLILLPVAAEMILEQVTSRNIFSVLGGVPEEVVYRNGRLRSQGPFAHPILAGTVGAACLPLMVGIWGVHRGKAVLGGLASLGMVICSASSGPLLSMIFGLLAVMLWKFRESMRYLRLACFVGYIMLDIIMKAPAYFLIARIDLTGGSTGWHRAELIRSSIEHIREWWLVGTDYTRHWMPTGVPWSEDHTDITNHYLAQGVSGGVVLMILFIAVIWSGFRCVGQYNLMRNYSTDKASFFVWCIGCSLFAHATTFISVSYFDQSIIFLYLNLVLCAAALPKIRHALRVKSEARSEVG